VEFATPYLPQSNQKANVQVRLRTSTLFPWESVKKMDQDNVNPQPTNRREPMNKKQQLELLRRLDHELAMTLLAQIKSGEAKASTLAVAQRYLQAKQLPDINNDRPPIDPKELEAALKDFQKHLDGLDEAAREAGDPYATPARQ
jgi:hypothetical protein